MPVMFEEPPGRWNATVTGESTASSFETTTPISARSAQKSKVTGSVPPASPSVRWLTCM